METLIHLQRNFFSDKERLIAGSGKLSAFAFLYDSGVHALRIKNARGELIILPFKGQQIWRASFDGKELTMKSMFDEPCASNEFGESYGCFMLHCGMTAMGNPSSADRHPQHGELPSISYDKAYLTVGHDQKGCYMEVWGEVYYRQAFEVGYLANPKIRLYENETIFDISMTVNNNITKPLSYAYLCHVNFRPIEGGALIDTSKSVLIHKDIPEDFINASQLKAYMDQLEKDPKIMNQVDSKTQFYNPEIVFTMTYDKDPDGWAHCMQLDPDGSANYVAFRPDETPYGIRWIARTGDEDAMGMVLPATAEHKGLSYCKEHHQMRMLPPGESITFYVKAGYLDQSETEKIRRKMK